MYSLERGLFYLRSGKANPSVLITRHPLSLRHTLPRFPVPAALSSILLEEEVIIFVLTTVRIFVVVAYCVVLAGMMWAPTHAYRVCTRPRLLRVPTHRSLGLSRIPGRTTCATRACSSSGSSSSSSAAPVDKTILKPASFNSPVLTYLSTRGFIHQCTNYEGLDKLLSNKSIPVYLGFGTCTMFSTV
jgi:hypothetical protein